ncbi:MAG: hypothetical protein ABFR19_02310, partial [Pseudomonadota bacterium]
ELLDSWRRELAAPAPVAQWQHRVNRMIDQLLLPDEDDEQVLRSVRDALDKLVGQATAAGFDGELDASVLRQHLASQVGSDSGSRRFLTGRVTFCNMVPMRSIPFRVVCLLGMNDSAYPRIDQPLGFDLIAGHPRKGDRSRREDDRYLFLESLLSAREVLHISYVGNSQQDNSAMLPSVVVSELLDYVEQGYQLADGEMGRHLLTEHPLQPFSERNFGLGSYAAEWLERGDGRQQFFDEAVNLPPEPPEVIELHDLKRFFDNPSRHFLEQLGIANAEYDEALEESELFELDNLEAYQLKVEVLSGLLDERDTGHGYLLAKGRGELPHGSFGELVFAQATAKLEEFSRQILPLLERRDEPVDVRVDVGETEINGRLSTLVDGGLFSYRPADLKAKDQLRLWIDHLALCAHGRGGRSVHMTPDGNFVLEAVKQKDAVSQLSWLASRYREGHSMPLPLYPTTSLAYAEKIADGKDENVALSAARRKWEDGYYPGEGSDPWFEQAMRGRDPLDAQFQRIAEEVLVPMLNAAGKD